MSESCETFEQLMAHPDLASLPVLVLANKQDKDGALSPAVLRGPALLNAMEVSRDGRAFKLCGVSALKGEGVKEALLWLVTVVKSEGPREGSGEDFL